MAASESWGSLQVVTQLQQLLQQHYLKEATVKSTDYHQRLHSEINIGMVIFLFSDLFLPKMKGADSGSLNL